MCPLSSCTLPVDPGVTMTTIMILIRYEYWLNMNVPYRALRTGWEVENQLCSNPIATFKPFKVYPQSMMPLCQPD